MAIGILLALLGGAFVCLQNTFNANVKKQVSVWSLRRLFCFSDFWLHWPRGSLLKAAGYLNSRHSRGFGSAAYLASASLPA